jgi:1,2-phenylacetyl-CoA epoxidase PaaB subunit
MARDVYTRRQEGVSIWVVPSIAITASNPDDKGELFDPAADKIYRHPTFYEIPGRSGAHVMSAIQPSVAQDRSKQAIVGGSAQRSGKRGGSYRVHPG